MYVCVLYLRQRPYILAILTIPKLEIPFCCHAAWEFAWVTQHLSDQLVCTSLQGTSGGLQTARFA